MIPSTADHAAATLSRLAETGLVSWQPDRTTDARTDFLEAIAELQDIARNLPTEAVPLFVSAVFRLGYNQGEHHENIRQGLLRDADYLHQEGGPRGTYSYNEWARLINRWNDFSTDRLANQSEPPTAPADDGDPGYRDRCNRLPELWLPGDRPAP